MSNSIGLYIHIPFCKHKCPYCDFFSGNADENTFDNYVIELKDKIKYWSEKTKRDVAKSLFICYTHKQKTTVLQGGVAPFLNRMEVMSMKHFTFQDLMAFGMFILALLTFIFLFCK